MHKSRVTLDSIVAKALEGKKADDQPYFMAVIAAPRGGKSSMVKVLKNKAAFDDAGRINPKEKIINTAHAVVISEKLFNDWPERVELRSQGIQHAEKSIILEKSVPQSRRAHHRFRYCTAYFRCA